MLPGRSILVFDRSALLYDNPNQCICICRSARPRKLLRTTFEVYLPILNAYSALVYPQSSCNSSTHIQRQISRLSPPHSRDTPPCRCARTCNLAPACRWRLSIPDAVTSGIIRVQCIHNLTIAFAALIEEASSDTKDAWSDFRTANMPCWDLYWVGEKQCKRSVSSGWPRKWSWQLLDMITP